MTVSYVFVVWMPSPKGRTDRTLHTLKKSGAKTAPQWNHLEKRLRKMFEKETVPLTKVVPFAKTVSQWSRFPEHFLVENGTNWQSGTTTVPKWGPSCGHENGSTFLAHLC